MRFTKAEVEKVARRLYARQSKAENVKPPAWEDASKTVRDRWLFVVREAMKVGAGMGLTRELVTMLP